MLPATKVLFDGIRHSQRNCLARAITLIESSNKLHQQQAAFLLDSLAAGKNTAQNLLHSNTFRIGVAGPPGAGKVRVRQVVASTHVKFTLHLVTWNSLHLLNRWGFD
jgi:putative protein kinase ArgK-like GTPase of G3E family